MNVVDKKIRYLPPKCSGSIKKQKNAKLYLSTHWTGKSVFIHKEIIIILLIFVTDCNLTVVHPNSHRTIWIHTSYNVCGRRCLYRLT